MLYNCPQGCSDDLQKIRDFLAAAKPDDAFHEVKLVATSYPVPGHRFALMAWGTRLFLDRWDPGQAERFYESHVDQGPEFVR